jgi:hypothetical protein
MKYSHIILLIGLMSSCGLQLNPTQFRLIVVNDTSSELGVRLYSLNSGDTIFHTQNAVMSGDTLIDLIVESDDDLFEPAPFLKGTGGIIDYKDSSYDLKDFQEASFNIFRGYNYVNQGNNKYLMTITDEDFD